MSEQKSDIRVTPALKAQEGRCNACQGDRAISDRVWMVDVRTVSVRFCDTCAAELIDKLHRAFRLARERS